MKRNGERSLRKRLYNGLFSMENRKIQLTTKVFEKLQKNLKKGVDITVGVCYYN